MPNTPSLAANAGNPDRYVSFRGIDFERNMQDVLHHLHRYIDDPQYGNAFWDLFKQKMGRIDAGQAGFADKLLVLHSHTYYMKDLFEEHGDEAALAALMKLEEECF